MSDAETQFSTLSQTDGFLLAKQAATHFGLWLAVISLFAANDSWFQLTNWGLAALLSALTGVAAGFITVNLAHEWFHYLGARLAGANYSISPRPSLFVFDWKFDRNSLTQFYTMSIAGSVGGAAALTALVVATESGSGGRTALIAGAAASFAFGSIIEWPVLARTAGSRDPLQELSKLTPTVLGWSAAGSALAGLVTWFTLT